MDRRRFLAGLGAAGSLAFAGCLSRNAAAAAGRRQLTLAATTTTHDSGLLGALLPGFEARFDVRVKPVINGSGAALRTAADGDADVTLTHAKPLEEAFLADGHGVNRREVMVNDFLVVGPDDDPVGVAGADPVGGFEAVAAAGATFLSRGDRSGTHLRERELWAAADLEPGGRWYRETGQGMGNTLAAARELDAYTLTDRGSFLATRTGDLRVLVEGGLDDPSPLLRNEYATMATNPTAHDVQYPLAMAFIGYLTGPAQATIREFRIRGRRAFRPLAA